MIHARLIKENDRVETSTTRMEKQEWGIVRRLKVKHKLRNSICSCMNRILPVSEIVFQITVVGDAIFNCCGKEMEL